MILGYSPRVRLQLEIYGSRKELHHSCTVAPKNEQQRLSVGLSACARNHWPTQYSNFSTKRTSKVQSVCVDSAVQQRMRVIAPPPCRGAPTCILHFLASSVLVIHTLMLYETIFNIFFPEFCPMRDPDPRLRGTRPRLVRF